MQTPAWLTLVGVGSKNDGTLMGSGSLTQDHVGLLPNLTPHTLLACGRSVLSCELRLTVKDSAMWLADAGVLLSNFCSDPVPR
jgi:hypothetical protein